MDLNSLAALYYDTGWVSGAIEALTSTTRYDIQGLRRTQARQLVERRKAWKEYLDTLNGQSVDSGDKCASIPVGDEQEAPIECYDDWLEHEALIKEQAMGDPVFSDEENMDDLYNEVEALAREVAQLRSKLKGLDIGEKPQ